MNIQISDHNYALLMQAAQMRGTTAEALIESLAEQLSIGCAANKEVW